MGYVLIGVLWCWWLEWYTTNRLKGTMSKNWVWRERIFHSVLWPVSLSIFCYEFFRGIW